MNGLKMAAISGVVGCFLLVITVVVTILGYKGPAGEAYQITNHFISELGWKAISARAMVFNYGLMVCSILLAVFALGLTSLFQGWRRIVVGVLAVATSVFCFLVGLFPVDDLTIHLSVAFLFFHSALALALAVSVITLISKRPTVLPKWTVVLGFLTAMAFTALVMAPKDALRDWIADPPHFVRPGFWAVCVLEWVCFFSVLTWICAVAGTMYRSG